MLQPNDVANTFSSYNQESYKAESYPDKKNKTRNILNSINLNKLTVEEVDQIKCQITKQEIKKEFFNSRIIKLLALLASW